MKIGKNITHLYIRCACGKSVCLIGLQKFTFPSAKGNSFVFSTSNSTKVLYG